MKRTNPTEHNIEREVNKDLEGQIYRAFKRSPKDAKISQILNELDFGFPLNARLEYPATAMVKALIFKRLKGIKFQAALARYLRSDETDALNLGFFRGVDNSLKIPDQRTFSWFARRHLDGNKKQLTEFAASTIESIADKFGIVLDAEPLRKKKATPPKEMSKKTIYNTKDRKLRELCRIIRRKIYPKIRLEIRSNSIFKKSDFLDLLTHIALTEDFAENGSKTLQQILNKRTPVSDTLLYHIKKYGDREALQSMFIEIFDLIYKMARRGNFFGGRRADVAIDFTDWFYYGRDRTSMVLGKKPEKGTTKCFRFATINVVERGERFTLLALPVSTLDTKEKILEKLISFAKERVPIRKLYVDRGFFSANVINLLKRMGVTFLMPAIMNNRVVDYANSVSPPAVINGYPMRDCKFNLIVLEKDGKRHAFATNIRLNNNDVLLAEKLFLPYSKRWGIETSYRVKKAFRGKTTSKNYIVRQFYFMMSVVLYNLWVLVNLLLSFSLFGKVEKKLTVTAKLFGTVLCTIVDPGD